MNELVIRFAKAHGIEGFDEPQPPSFWEKLPDPADSNTVREAWKTLTSEEKAAVAALFIKKVGINPLLKGRWEVAILILIASIDEEPTTLAELVCEVRGAK